MRVLFLVFILVVGGFAEVNSSTKVASEERGMPSYRYIKEVDKSIIDSAVLAPDGNSFYTLKGVLITHWQLSPMKILSSFKTNIIINVNSNTSHQIDISNDNKRIIICSYKEIHLWDIESKKHLKTVAVKDNIRSVVRSKYGFISIGSNNMLRIWNDEDLTLKNSIDLHKFYSTPANSMLNGDNILIVSSFDDAISFDLDTLKIIDRVTDEDASFFKTFSNKVESKYSDKFNPYILHRYMKGIGSGRLLRTRSSYENTTNNNEITLQKSFYNSKKPYRFIKSFLKKSRKFKRHIYFLYQFDDAWILINVRKKYFMGSGNMKKYLGMLRFKDDKIVPINNVTFKKYNKNINLKDLKMANYTGILNTFSPSQALNIHYLLLDNYKIGRFGITKQLTPYWL